MTTRYYDAIVLGNELGPLLAGALLARRGARVLVAGNGAFANRYRCFEFTFCRRPFSFTSSESPVCRRFLAELGLGQKLQRLLSEANPTYQVITKQARVDMRAEPEALRREVERELPHQGDAAAHVLELLARLNGEVDKLLSTDLVLPPSTFLERRQLARAEFQDPSRTQAAALSRVEELLRGELEPLFTAPCRFETAGPAGSQVAQARQIGAYLFGHQLLDGGRDSLVRLLSESISAVGGDLYPRLKAAEIAVNRGQVQGVRMFGQDALTGCRHVLVDMPHAELARLVAADQQPRTFKAEAKEDVAYGYVLNLGLNAPVIPSALAHTAFVVTGSGVGADLIRLEQQPHATPGRATLCASCTIPATRAQEIDGGALRDAMLDRLRWLLPFLDSHLCVLHSPFDGFGPIDLAGNASGDAPTVPHPEQVPRWEIPLPRAGACLGIGDASHRTGIKGLLQCGRQVVRGLGLEGELLAGWAGARLCGYRNRSNGRGAQTMRDSFEL